MSTSTHEPCPICGEPGCGGTVYPYLLSEYAAGRNRDHWRRIHERRPATPSSGSTPEDAALRAYVARHGCCGGSG